MQLSPYHKIFYYEWMLDPLSSKYNIVFDQNLSASLDGKRLQNALHRLISDYLILNSHVVHIDDKLSWVVNNEIIELEIFEAPCSQEQIFNYVSAPFEIESNALYRFAIFTESDGSYRFIAVLHHLLIDGNSFDAFINEISNYYNSPAYKTNLSLLEQRNLLESTLQLFDSHEGFDLQYQRFWAEKLAHIEPLDLRWAKSESDIDVIKEHRFSFEEEITEKLFNITSQLGTTTYAYSQCVLAVLLHKYTSKNEIPLSYPITIKGGLPLISGACVNTNINVYIFDDSTTIIDLIEQNKNVIKTTKAIGKNACHYPINKIVDNENKNLLHVMFAQTNLKDTSLKFVDVGNGNINHAFNIDLSSKIIFETEKKDGKINFRVRYNTKKIDENVITNFTHQYKCLFLNILRDLDSETNKTITQYTVLSDLEYDQIIYQWNKTETLPKCTKTIHELFEEQVLRTPNNVAVVYDNIKLTYANLNDRANQLAHYLRTEYNIKADDLIALHLDRSEHMLIAILGVLKSGGAYVPIDTTYPEKRIRYILNDTAANVLITDKHNYDSINGMHLNDLSIVTINADTIQQQLNQQEICNPKFNTDCRNLVYVMFTSGTIGMPKGVMVEHCSVTTRIISMIETCGISPESNYLFKTNYVFDVSFSDIFMTLLSGASLYITKSVFDINEICNLIEKNNINICHFVPSQLEVINDYLLSKNLLRKLQTINVSGEKFHKSLIYENSNIKYVNYYGPTETGEVTFDITDLKNHISEHLKLDTIGHPLARSTAYILDDHLRPLPIGAIGELYVGGDGLARAYLNLPELTQKLFISNPFQTLTEQHSNSNAKLYKTGDLVRYLPDGNMEYIGRSDNQVKIRGFRVELSEIETRLYNYPGIQQVVVLPRDHSTNTGSNKKYLVAYYASHTKLDENIILEFLAEELPDYMLPSVFVHLEQLPLTPNGKLDMRALPSVDITMNSNTYVAPKSELEQKVCAIYADILNLPVDQVGTTDNFFKLGGNSMLAIHMAFKLQHYLDITVSDIFEYKTPAKISQLIPANNINLSDKLEQIKQMYSKLKHNKDIYKEIEHQQIVYQQQITPFELNNKIKSGAVILLTGATGYLGSHLLHELLTTTNHVIYLPIRANSEKEAYTKICNKLKYYFDMDLNLYSDRVTIFTSNLSKVNLGLDEINYEKLINDVQSIIHSAALVKHYGSHSEFYLENVQATINLLELARLTAKDFHYISTIGVFTTTAISDSAYNIFTEEIIDDNHANLDNIYTKTKYQGEQVVLKYRDYGINTNIYRVGNLAINSETNKTQENIEDNAFFHRVKTTLKLGMIPPELSELEISPVDCTATAITLLFNQTELHNQIYHVFNPIKCDLYKLYSNSKTENIELVSFPTFIDNIKEQLSKCADKHEIELFVLHQWGLYFNSNDLIQTIIFQDKTNYLLNKLKFKWPEITIKMLSQYSNMPCS